MNAIDYVCSGCLLTLTHVEVKKHICKCIWENEKSTPMKLHLSWVKWCKNCLRPYETFYCGGSRKLVDFWSRCIEKQEVRWKNKVMSNYYVVILSVLVIKLSFVF